MEQLLRMVSPEKTLLWGEGPKATVRILKNTPGEQGREITLEWQGSTYRFRIPFADTASFENCMNAVCLLLLKGKSPEYIAAKVEALQPIAMRMEIKDGINRCVLINDYYNSDAASFHLALNTLSM